MNRLLRLALWTVSATMLVGCGSLLASDKPPEKIYWLEEVALRPDRAPTGDLPDLVVAVTAMPGLDTDRILVKGPGAQINFYAGARWPETLPDIVDATVRLSLESSGRFNRVVSGSRAGPGEWLLDLELRQFFAVVKAGGSPPQIQVKLAGHVNCGQFNKAISAATRSRARENTLTYIVAAFQSATDDALINLDEQLQTICHGQ